MPTVRILNNTRAVVENCAKPSVIDKLLRFHPVGYQFMPAFSNGMWDGYIRLFNKQNGAFPVGCLDILRKHYVKKGKKFKVIDEREDPRIWGGRVVKELFDKKLGKITLRPDQRHAIRTALQAGRGVIKSSTGSGKTEMQAGTIASLETIDPPKTLIIVPNRKLVTQTCKRLEMRLGYKIGRISHGKWDEQQVTVAIPKTLIQPKFRQQRAKLFATVELLMLDECHHSASHEWYTTINKCQAYYRFGFSGTPLDRTDGANLRLIGATGPLLLSIETETLVEQGILAKPYVEIVEIYKPQLPGSIKYQDAYKMGVVKNIYYHKRVATLISREAGRGKIVLVLVTQISHGKYLSKRLAEMYPDLKHEFVWSATDEELLEQTVDRFESGKLKVLIASPIFGEGTDIPAVDTLIIADAGKSAIKVIQKAGRAMRAKHGKANKCRIIDFAHLTHYKLADHSLKRIQIYKREGFNFV